MAILSSFCERQTELVKQGHHYKYITVNNLLKFLFQEIKKKNNIHISTCIFVYTFYKTFIKQIALFKKKTEIRFSKKKKKKLVVVVVVTYIQVSFL